LGDDNIAKPSSYSDAVPLVFVRFLVKSGESTSFVVTYVDDFTIDRSSVDVYVMDVHKNAELVVLYL